MLAGADVVLYPFLKRKQGWILPKGNPMDIETVVDIAEKKANFVNRQKGAGTRILLDMLLEENGISSEEITGYDREMFSHLAVAAEVNGDSQGAGLGIYPAAKAMDLDFVPVADEEYDLLMTKSFYESESGRLLIEIIHSADFKKQVEKIGGYEVVENAQPKILG
jgi:putative molybdopterin biosynthesis protein